MLTVDLGAHPRKLPACCATGSAAPNARPWSRPTATGSARRRSRPRFARRAAGIFFVAHAAEGISLRQALGPEPEIYVLNGVHPGAEDDCADAGLTAVANSAAQLAAWRRPRSGAAANDCRSPCRSTAACRGSECRRRRSRASRRRRFRRASSSAGDEPPRLRRRAGQSGQRGAAAQPSRRCGAKLPAAPASLANSSGIFLGGALSTTTSPGRARRFTA